MQKPLFSVIIPIFNRPDEVEELLESLENQTFGDFEVIIVEDGSTADCKAVVDQFEDRLNIRYFYKENSGQGFSRNYGFERAVGKWLIVFDSDCIIPPDYFKVVGNYLAANPDIDAYGGPDRAHKSFTNTQKAISYSMTSIFTTGGIRGNKQHVGTFHPRSFNMGISSDVFAKTKGYIIPKKGEDIEFSIRIIENGFKTALIEDAFVYHKRRTDFMQFFKQLHFFGTARINVFRFYKSELKAVHFFPSIFLIGVVCTALFLLVLPQLGILFLLVYSFYFFLILFDSLLKTKSIVIGFLSVFASFVQLSAYGMGLIQEGLIYLRKG